MKKLLSTISLVLVFALLLTACGKEAKKEEAPAKTEVATEAPAEEEAAEVEAAEEEAAEEEVAAAPLPGEAGFDEFPIGEEQIVGNYQIATVYFQAVDMLPAGKNPSAEESDMHLEADILLTEEAAVKYGFGKGEVWPPYLQVDYKIMDQDGKVMDEGSFMPMNAEDGPHYGANIKKGKVPLGQYKIEYTLTPSDYLIHVDAETGVPAGEDADQYFVPTVVTFDWNYTGEQFANE